jgi:predicted PurR-regulated permease PerM
MFLTTFFLLRDGQLFVKGLVRVSPVKKSYSERFMQEMHLTVKGVILGQVGTAMIQGALVGLLFWALGLSNPFFWGVIAAIVSIVPIFGPFFIYIPAGAYLLLQERYIAGAFMLILGTFIISQIDNIIRPYITSRTANVHPLIPILGVIGGLKLWGFAGFVLGPLALAAFVALIRFVSGDDEEPKRSRS